MRKIVITLGFCLVCVLSFAQNPLWKCHSQEECAALADSLLLGAKHEYQPDSQQFPKLDRGNYIYYFVEKAPAGEPRRLAMSFRHYMEGENKALEIEGTPTYSLDIIEGPYLDLFPIWQQYIDPTADPETLAAEGSGNAKVGPEDRFDRFIIEQKSGATWRLYR